MVGAISPLCNHWTFPYWATPTFSIGVSLPEVIMGQLRKLKGQGMKGPWEPAGRACPSPSSAWAMQWHSSTCSTILTTGIGLVQFSLRCTVVNLAGEQWEQKLEGNVSVPGKWRDPHFPKQRLFGTTTFSQSSWTIVWKANRLGHL